MEGSSSAFHESLPVTSVQCKTDFRLALPAGCFGSIGALSAARFLPPPAACPHNFGSDRFGRPDLPSDTRSDTDCCPLSDGPADGADAFSFAPSGDSSADRDRSYAVTGYFIRRHTRTDGWSYLHAAPVGCRNNNPAAYGHRHAKALPDRDIASDSHRYTASDG